MATTKKTTKKNEDKGGAVLTKKQIMDLVKSGKAPKKGKK